MIERKRNVPSFIQKELILTRLLGRCSAVSQTSDRRKKISADIFGQGSTTGHTAQDSMKTLNSVFLSASYIVIYIHYVRNQYSSLSNIL
jgi:hypothetical protein